MPVAADTLRFRIQPKITVICDKFGKSVNCPGKLGNPMGLASMGV